MYSCLFIYQNIVHMQTCTWYLFVFYLFIRLSPTYLFACLFISHFLFICLFVCFVWDNMFTFSRRKIIKPFTKKPTRNRPMASDNLQLLPQSFYFLQEEVNIVKSGCWIGYNHPEEVWFITKRLITNHRVTFLHHHGFDLWRHLRTIEVNKQVIIYDFENIWLYHPEVIAIWWKNTSVYNHNYELDTIYQQFTTFNSWVSCRYFMNFAFSWTISWTVFSKCHKIRLQW